MAVYEKNKHLLLCAYCYYTIVVPEKVVKENTLLNVLYEGLRGNHSSNTAVVAQRFIPHLLAPRFSIKYPLIPHLTPQLFFINQ